MEIVRVLSDGVVLKIEPTKNEMEKIYWEQMRIFRTNELLEYLQQWAEEDGYNRELTAEKAQELLCRLNADKKLLDIVASKYERYEMDYPDGEQEADCVFNALKYFKMI